MQGHRRMLHNLRGDRLELLALMTTIAVKSEIDANRSLLGNLQMLLQSVLWPLQEPDRSRPPSFEVDFYRELLFPLTRGEYLDSGIQMKDLLYIARKSFVTFCPRAWAQGDGFPAYDLLEGFTSRQMERAKVRCAAAEALLSMDDFEWLARNFREERRLLNVDMLHSHSTLSVIHVAERTQNHVLLSEMELGARKVQAHVATLGDAWTAEVAGDTLSEKHAERRRVMQRENLPVAWRQATEADAYKAITARRITQDHPGWWPGNMDTFPGLSAAEYRQTMKLLRRARKRLEGRLKAGARNHEKNEENENHMDLA